MDAERSDGARGQKAEGQRGLKEHPGVKDKESGGEENGCGVNVFGIGWAHGMGSDFPTFVWPIQVEVLPDPGVKFKSGWGRLFDNAGGWFGTSE